MRKPISDAIVEKILELYPNHTTKEIAVTLRISKTTVSFYAHKYNVQHSEEHEKKIREKIQDVLNSADAIEKRRGTLRLKKKRLYIMERFRLLNGEKQKTNVHISQFSIAARKIISKYINKYNYFQFDDDPRTLYYDGETKRTNTESYISQKYRIKFSPADE